MRLLPFQNLPRDALPDGSPVREKLATLKRPKKYKTSENDYSHGSFFLRIGGIGEEDTTFLMPRYIARRCAAGEMRVIRSLPFPTLRPRGETLKVK